VTHCFHPWFGREFEFAVRRRTWGEDRVYFYLDDGAEVGQMPAAWTDAVGPDPFVTVAAGRCEFQIDALLAAAALVAVVGGPGGPALEGVREISP
jgi:hypothetical protein